MPPLIEIARQRRRGTSLLEIARGRRKTSTADLRQQVLGLEALQRATGAPGLDQDKPGALARIIDVLSRPNYAIAGFSEEIFGEEPSVTRGVKRALVEIFSGVGGLQGEKRAFGEVLERLGAGTKTLADAFPALEGTWVGNFGSRGAAGLALDIALDPLTYVTFGAGSGFRVAAGKGGKAFLNPRGVQEFNKILQPILKREAKRFADDVIGRNRAHISALSKAEKEFERRFAGEAGEIAKELLQPGGARIFGAKIPGTDKLGPALAKVTSMLPESIATPAVEGAKQMQEGMKRFLRGVFSPEGALANLPEPIRTRAVRITNDFFRGSTAHREHLLMRVGPLEDAYRKLEKADSAIGQRWHDVREGVLPRTAIKNADELALFDQTMALYDSMGKTLVEHGVLQQGQILRNYIFHQYKNLEDLAQYHPRPAARITGEGSTFTKEREFETLELAKEESKRLHELSLHLMSKGEAQRLYPILEPEYDVFKNMRSYVTAHADALARKAWREEMVAQFGKKLDEFDFDGLYEAGAKVKPSKSPGAPKDFTPENVPLVRAIEEGQIEPALVNIFGKEGARYVAVKSKITGDELVYLPKAIVDSLESINSSLFNTKDYGAFRQVVRGFDWLNNNFKWGAYTIWPASLTRDAYSNIFLSMLRVGTAALDPKRHADAVLLMAGRDLGRQFAGSGYTLRELRDMSKRFGVWVPGRVFVEQTGKFNLGKFRSKWLTGRASIENEARVMLWLEEIRRGADPRLAADTVGQFLFNYSEVSQIERELFRRLIPFYTFTRKNVELQWKALRSKPGLVINQVKPFRGYNDENEMMVKFEAEGLKLRLDRDGRTLHALTGIDLPLRNLDTIWAGGVGPTGRRIMGMVTPVLKVPLEATFGRDLFTGGDLKRTRADTLGRIMDATNTPKALKDWFGYKKEIDDAGRPRYSMDGRRYALVVKSWMFSRAFSTSDRVFREYLVEGDANIQAALLDVLTGVRYKDMNLDEQQRTKLFRRRQQLRESLARRGILPTFEVSGRPNTEGVQ